ncbi:MAG: response regulator [Parcubacteria group bacterium Gr01-1014_38]|nr:MAG: response regulator [Parcubacteria group bacterium Gr01-1014_38]
MTPLLGAQKRVLVVEDEEALLSTLCDELEESGFTVEPAVTGEEALRKIREKPLDGIILDLLLPGGMDGLGVLAQLKESEQTKDIPVVILSNIGDDEKVREALDQGADAYFVKTRYSLEDLIERLRLLFQQKPAPPAQRISP